MVSIRLSSRLCWLDGVGDPLRRTRSSDDTFLRISGQFANLAADSVAFELRGHGELCCTNIRIRNRPASMNLVERLYDQ